MKPDREEMLRMAREAKLGAFCLEDGPSIEALERLVTLAYEAGARAERERIIASAPKREQTYSEFLSLMRQLESKST